MATEAPVSCTVTVPGSPTRAYALFTERIGAWWPLASHSVFGSGSAGVAVEHGFLVERATDGRTGVWGEVLTWEPPDLLAFTWHPAAPEADRTQVTMTFRSVGGGTEVQLEHVGWEVLGDRATAVRDNYAGQDGWTMVLGRFAVHAEGHSTD